MAYPPKIQRALSVLAETDIGRWSYAPPAYRLFWWLGVPIRPPHFNTFVGNFLAQGIVSGAIFTLIMCIWISRDRPLTDVLPQCALFAILSGLTSAAWIRSRRRKHRLPAWSDLDDVAGRFD
jgi:hypothetical protein